MNHFVPSAIVRFVCMTPVRPIRYQSTLLLKDCLGKLSCASALPDLDYGLNRAAEQLVSVINNVLMACSKEGPDSTQKVVIPAVSVKVVVA
ncbi:hypothetical protein ACJ2CR_19380 [Myxococcus faecalis]|uniref:hypothetical protein n=1 Tax=Myxococcus faecalis TaxID=3115646 RepID=UPI0038D0A6D0